MNIYMQIYVQINYIRVHLLLIFALKTNDYVKKIIINKYAIGGIGKKWEKKYLKY